MSFTHLHVHTENSLLDGLAKMKDAFTKAAADGQPALAITDHGTLGGIWKAKAAARASNIKIIPGIELYIALTDEGRLGNRLAPEVMETTDVGDDSDADEGVKKKRYYHLTLLATTREGWDNLVRIVNASEHSKFGKYPMADLALIGENSAGLVVLTGCLGGPVLGPVAHGNVELARENLADIVTAMGNENVYVEVMEHGIRPETLAMPQMKALADEFGIPVVATNDAHYTHAEDAVTHDAWLALRTKATLDDKNRYRFSGSGFHLRSNDEMLALFTADVPANPDSLLTDSVVRAAIEAMRNPLLKPMMSSGWDEELARRAISTLPASLVLDEDTAAEIRSKTADAFASETMKIAEQRYNAALESSSEADAGELRASVVRGRADERDAVIAGALDAARVQADVDAFRTALSHEDDAVREFVARAAREQAYYTAFDAPSKTPLHPRVWWKEAVENTALVADRVASNVVPDGNPKLPKFPTPAGYESNVKYLAQLISDGADRIYGTDRPKEVSDRLTSEWKTIHGMGFVDYFLIDHDFVSWAKSDKCIHQAVEGANGCSVAGCSGTKIPILVGPGRGSAAGSLTAYVLGITGLDPLEHDLLFERFLEPGRADFPDIDIDFEQARKEEVLDYLTHRWGEGHVALIGTYGVAKSRRAIKDAARLIDEGGIGNALSKVIPVIEGQPLGFGDLLDENNMQTAEFRRELTKAGAKGTAIMDLAIGFVDTVNGASIHACGVVISDLYLPDIIPLRVHKNGRLVTQWDSRDVESFGLIKFDVLALRNLDIAHTAMDYILETSGEQLSIETIPHPDTKGDPRVDRAWTLLRDGRTAGIFQMEGAAMTSLTQDVQPDGINDLSAILALFRPGPISAGMPERYGVRKSGKEMVDYGIYTSEPAEQEQIATRLGDTYALMTYQEQMMLLGTTIAGFDTAMRSKLRKAIGKKNKELMAQVKVAFLDGAVKELRDEAGNLVSMAFRKDTAERVWAMFEGAASYAFNKSHSMAYGYLAYWTAYLKANWPGAYGAAILANTSDSDKRGQALRALPAEGIEVLAPDVNLSGTRSTPDGASKVRLGLGEISSVGGAGEFVVNERDSGGEFTTIEDLAFRVRISSPDKGVTDTGKHLPANQLIGLIESGALDAFGPRLGLTMVARLANDPLPAPVPDMEWGVIERAARQRQRLGVSIGEHPLVVFQNQVRAWSKKVTDEYGNVTFEEHATPISRVPSESGTPVTCIGLLAQWSEGSYKGGRKAAITLEGSQDRIEGVMWDRELGKQKMDGIPPIGWPVAVTSRVNVREFEQEDDEGNISITTVKQLTASRVDVVSIDDPVAGSLPTSIDIPRLPAGRPAAPVAEVEPRPRKASKKAAPKPAAVTSETEQEPEPEGSGVSLVFDPVFDDTAPAPVSEPTFDEEFPEPPEDAYAAVDPVVEPPVETSPGTALVAESTSGDIPVGVLALTMPDLRGTPRLLKAIAGRRIDVDGLEFHPRYSSRHRTYSLRRGKEEVIRLTLVDA